MGFARTGENSRATGDGETRICPFSLMSRPENYEALRPPIDQPEGRWLLRRPLTLPESSKPLFLTIRLSSHKLS